MTQPSHTPTGVRPRYGRISALSGAALTCLISMLGAVGVIPVSGSAAAAPTPPSSQGALSLTALDPGLDPSPDPASSSEAAPAASDSSSDPIGSPSEAETTQDLAVPSDSGEGRRVVMDQSRQRVWLVDEASSEEQGATQEPEPVVRTYLVSGSLTDNLRPGSYEVFSRSLDATGIDGSSMRFMVRFTTGDNAAIGFHDIPEMDGEPMQTRDELGTPQSHGCVRQARPDAKAMWRFATVGTPVVVTA